MSLPATQEGSSSSGSLYTHAHARATKPNTITIVRTSSLDNFIVPPTHSLTPGELPPPRWDFVVSGIVVINLAKPRWAKKLRVSFIAEARLLFPGRQSWEDDVIHETSMDIGAEEGLYLEAGPQQFEFSFVLPPTMAGYERSLHGRVNHRLEANLIGQPSKKFSGFFSSSSPTRGRSPSPSRSTKTSPGPSRIMSAESLTSMASLSLSSPPLDPAPGPSTSSSLLTDPRRPHPDVKWLQGSMTATKEMFIVPIASPDREAIQLDFSKRMAVPSLGSWTWSLESDSISVGSYLVLKSGLIDVAPGASIWMIKLYIAQKIALKSPRRPEEDEVTFPATKLKFWEKGKMPEEGVKPIWSNREGWDGKEFGLEEIIRMPTENQMRPSTCIGTITPIHMSHEIMLHVYFSIEGQDAFNQPSSLTPWGQVRRAELNTPIFIPHCACTKRNLQLPTYADSLGKSVGLFDGGKDDELFDHCACGEPLETLAGRELSRQAREPGIAGVWGEEEENRGRRRDGGERGKSEYSPTLGVTGNPM